MSRPVSGRVTRLRQLTPGQQQRLRVLKHASRLLDSAFQFPGTPYRFGLDPIVGLVPGIGDLVSPLFTIGVLWQAHDLGVPRVVLLRMLGNVAIDALVGAVPLLGDLFDFAWKSNDMNMALLEQHASEERAASGGDWLFVAVLSLIVLALAAVPVLVLWFVISTISGSWR